MEGFYMPVSRTAVRAGACYVCHLSIEKGEPIITAKMHMSGTQVAMHRRCWTREPTDDGETDNS